MAGSEERETRWQQETAAALAELAAWRREHPRAAAWEIEVALDERLGELRARLLAAWSRPAETAVAPDAPLAAHPTRAPTEAPVERAGDSVLVQPGLEYAVHDGVSLLGDLYRPSAPGIYPTLVLIHGGGWQSSSRTVYHHWGPYLAQHGYVGFSVDYRLCTPTQASYPQSVHDVKAAVQYVRGRGESLGVDPGRIGVMGNSAGGHLAALVALAGDAPCFANPYPDDAYRALSARVKVAVPIYGVFDLLRQWEHDQLTRPRDQITEKYLGGTPMEIRDRYYEASPLSWATVQNNGVAFLVVWGTEDDIVEAESQSVAFVTALKRAAAHVRTVPIVGAPHFWIGETPVEESGSFTAYLAPRLLRFLAEHL